MRIQQTNILANGVNKHLERLIKSPHLKKYSVMIVAFVLLLLFMPCSERKYLLLKMLRRIIRQRQKINGQRDATGLLLCSVQRRLFTTETNEVFCRGTFD